MIHLNKASGEGAICFSGGTFSYIWEVLVQEKNYVDVPQSIVLVHRGDGGEVAVLDGTRLLCHGGGKLMAIHIHVRAVPQARAESSMD
jgi:hypothetical protein